MLRFWVVAFASNVLGAAIFTAEYGDLVAPVDVIRSSSSRCLLDLVRSKQWP